MLSYKLSKREILLVLVLGVLLVVIAWYKLVYEYTTSEINQIRSDIETTNAEIEADEARVAKLKSMKSSIAAHKANGDEPTVMPTYDNTKPLMTELDGILSSANNYNLSFDAVDTSSGDYILRGMVVSFSSDVYSQAEEILDAIANGPYPCIIDTVSFSNKRKTDSSSSILDNGDDIRSVFASRSTEPSSSVRMHVTFFERPSEEMLAAKAQEEAKAQALAEAQAEAQAAS